MNANVIDKEEVSPTPRNGPPPNAAAPKPAPENGTPDKNGGPDSAADGSRSSSLPVPGIEAAKGPGEDEEIFSFFKRYIGLLTIVGSLPVITAGIDVLAPPSTATKLSAISSFTCIVVLGLCVLFKKSFVTWSVENSWKRAIAPVVASLLLLGALILTAIYCAPAGATGRVAQTVAKEGTLRYLIYLAIFPCFVGALGVTLMASYTQFRGARLEALIDQKVVDPDTNKRLKKTVENYVSVLTATADSRIERFNNWILRELDGALAKLNMGYVEVVGPKIDEMQKVLLKHFKQSAYSVSDRDLKFWLNGFCEHIKSSDELIAKQFLRLNIDAVNKGTKVTRIFIFKDSDFNHNKADIVAVLAKHQEAGIGWAVLIHEELPTHLKSAQQSFDFCLLDEQSAVALLSNYNMDSKRRLYVLLNVPGSLRARIEEYGALHQQLVAQCWLASKGFCDVHAPNGTFTLDDAKGANRGKIHALTFGSGQIIRIEQEEQIAKAIDFITSLRRKNMVYWGEVSSPDVVDLAGEWTYTVKGKEQDGPFKHQGECKAVIEDGEAYFIGVRRLTTRAGRSFSVEARWKSSPIRFADNGKMEYSSTISVNGEEFRGLGEIQFSSDRKRLTGKVHMIMGDNKLISADLEFNRRNDHSKINLDELAQHCLTA
jgi:predicted RNA-binding protein with PIN domain